MPCRARDSTGIKAEGEGEWNARKHGGPKRRIWRKIHIGIDEETLEGRAVEVTTSNVGDAPMLPELLGQIPPDQEIGSVTGDGAHDTRKCHDAIAARGAHAVIPPRKNANPWKPTSPGAIARNEAVNASRDLGRAPSFAGPFINADIIQREDLRDPSMEAAYEAARIAAARRLEMLEARRSFAAETVFSHPSKLELIEAARERGYLVIVMHVGVDGPDLSVARVVERRAEGGHDVPEDKIRARFVRSQPLIRQPVLQADRGMVFDNSQLNRPPRQMLVFAAGRLIQTAPVLPEWILRAYSEDLTA